MPQIRIVLVEDHDLARITMGYFLDSAEGITLVGEASDGPEGIQAAADHQPDVVLMDYFLPHLNGAQATAEITRVAPHARVIGISHNDSQAVIDAMLHAGAVAFVNKRSSMPDLIEAVRQAAGQGA
jgi:DNA-binding NarL/FixJ family response regulator